ncbi:hypothetical protein XBKB1_3180002 [Xenorhabdus bovienii str. kraussei Becker Underwood]|uniref:Uncharacterized protein n=1 Tax=Xenorhabdus bovienii str. kraussei Becker Underwood TaxID=1398204 RepID=A0A077PVV7_XENBV|nr:hypothetical protein XBKB1_3180002 [Xenorhabdus bovienii str. kraussei Becker Underwood]
MLLGIRLFSVVLQLEIYWVAMRKGLKFVEVSLNYKYFNVIV